MDRQVPNEYGSMRPRAQVLVSFYSQRPAKSNYNINFVKFMFENKSFSSILRLDVLECEICVKNM